MTGDASVLIIMSVCKENRYSRHPPRIFENGCPQCAVLEIRARISYSSWNSSVVAPERTRAVEHGLI